MTIIKTIIRWLFIISIPVLLLSSTVWTGATSTRLYQYGFQKYHVSQITRIDEAQLNEVAETLVNYFTAGEETPQVTVTAGGKEFELFHDHELVHLQDVKWLFQLAHRAMAVSLACIVIYILFFLLWEKGQWQDLARGIRWGGILTLCFIALAGILSFFGFQQVFVAFHYFTFGDPSQSPWILDPSKDYLIMLFPEPFWQDAAMFGGIAITMEALLLTAIAWLAPFIHKKRRRAKTQ